MKKMHYRLLSVLLTFVFISGTLTLPAAEGAETDSAFVFNPPSPPADYLPLAREEWPNESNTGLLPGWDHERLINENKSTLKSRDSKEIDGILYGPRRDTGAQYSEGRATIYANVEPTQPFLTEEDELAWSKSAGIMDGIAVGGVTQWDPYKSDPITSWYVPSSFSSNGRDNTTNTPSSNETFYTYSMIWGQIVIDEAYISDHNGRNSDGEFVIENQYIVGGLRISAANVVVRNCYIAASAGHKAGTEVNGWSVINVDPLASATIINCELNGLKGVSFGVMSSGNRTVLLKSDIYNVCDANYQWCNPRDVGTAQQQGWNFLIQDNYFHGFTHNVANGHKDGHHNHGVSNGVLKHNTVLNPPPYDTSCFIITNSEQYGSIQGILIEDNFLAGGGFTLYTSGTVTANTTMTNIWVLNNVFSNQFYPTVGVYGVWPVLDAIARIPVDGERWYDELTEAEIAEFMLNPMAYSSFRYGNTVYETGDNIDRRQPPASGPTLPTPGPNQWYSVGDLYYGYNAASHTGPGVHQLGRSYDDQLSVTFYFTPTVPTGYEAAVAFSGGGWVTPHETQTWQRTPAALRISGGVFQAYKGVSTGWTYVDRLQYNVFEEYLVEMTFDIPANTYSATVWTLDDNGGKDKAYVIADNFAFRRGGAGNIPVITAIDTVYTGPGTTNGFIIRDFTVAGDEPTLDNVAVSAFVTKLNGNQNDLTVIITEYYSDSTENVISETLKIDNNAAGTYQIENYRVYIDTKGNNQIRECYIVP